MLPHTRRNVLRRYLARPIEFNRRAHGRCHRGQISDYSINGMQFRSPVAMTRGERIWIRTDVSDRRSDGKRSPAAIQAVVCWCSDDKKPDTSGFSVGVTFCNGHSRPHHSGRSIQPYISP